MSHPGVAVLQSMTAFPRPLFWCAGAAYGVATALLFAFGRRTLRPLLLSQCIALLAATLTLVAGAALLRRQAPAPEAIRAACVTLNGWSWRETPDGVVEVTARVTPDAEGSVALDVRAFKGAEEDVYFPELLESKLARTSVQPHVAAQLERKLRRGAPGTVQSRLLRFSCRPPQGVPGWVGVVTYASPGALPSLEGTRDVVRPLPPPS